MAKRKPRGFKIKRPEKKVEKKKRLPRLVGYMRVSTENQDHDLQYDALKKEGVKDENIFQDKISGSKISRAGLDRCLKFLEAGDTLIVWKVDRLSRKLYDLVELMKRFEDAQIGFKSTTQNIDTTTAAGRMQMQILFIFAEFEREMIRERVKAGIKAKMDAGRERWGKLPDNEYEVADIKRLKKEGKTYREISKELGISIATISRALKRKKGTV